MCVRSLTNFKRKKISQFQNNLNQLHFEKKKKRLGRQFRLALLFLFSTKNKNKKTTTQSSFLYFFPILLFVISIFFIF